MIYWISTTLLSVFLFLSAGSYLIHQKTIEGVGSLGFPDFFRIELAFLKLLACIVLLLPYAPVQIKEWAYAGVALFLITAIIAHSANGDSWLLNSVNVVLFAVLFVSRYYLPIR